MFTCKPKTKIDIFAVYNFKDFRLTILYGQFTTCITGYRRFSSVPNFMTVKMEFPCKCFITDLKPHQ